MTTDDVDAFVELLAKLTPAERQRLLHDAEALVSERAAPEREPGSPPRSSDEHREVHVAAGPTPCPRCGLNPGPSDVYCSRCGNRVAF